MLEYGMLKFYVLLFSLILSFVSYASDGLVIHAAEIGVGKFHRIDNKYNFYGNSVWRVYILPNEAGAQTPLVINNDDGSKTVFFSTLEELIKSTIEISETEGRPVDLLTVHGHGVPGGMWFPKNQELKKSLECVSWADVAYTSDEKSYKHYYSGLQKFSALRMRLLSQNAMSPAYQCISGLRAWKDILAAYPKFKEVLAPQSQIHFMACVVGLGLTGDNFLTGLANELYKDKPGSLQAPVKFGLGDWSMPEGMGFWDYLTDAQQIQDASQYPMKRRDRNVMQKGDIKVAQVLIPGEVQLGLILDEEFMLLEKDERPVEHLFIPF